MNNGLQEQLERARQEVARDPVGSLSFGTRKDVLKELGPLLKDNQGRHTIIGIGLIRRTRLCIDVVKRVLQLWEASYPTTDPHRMIELARQYIERQGDREHLRAEASEFRGALDMSDTPDKQVAYLVARSSVCAAYVAASDELLEPDEGISEEELRDPQDPDFWDCAYWAAAAEAGGMPWEPGFNAQRYRGFWNWYLDVAVPNASTARE
jgi:hypothetical protein